MSQTQRYEQQQQQQQCAAADVLYTAAGQPVAVSLPLQAEVHTAYEDRQSVIAGVILIIAGALSVLITIISIGVYNAYTFLEHGILFGIVVSKTVSF